jgi:Domain of unknown function (DUF4123)
MTDADLAAIEELLWPREWAPNVWMIVDAARDRRIYPMLVESYLDISCLYSGMLSPALERAAPYLVRLEYQGSYSRRLIRAAWGNSWGVMLRCDSSLEKLRRHLRELLLVRDHAGRCLVFRFYDPRVLRVYLPTCNSQELRTVFGPVDSFYVEDRDPRDVWCYRRDDGRLRKDKNPLTETVEREHMLV